MTGKIINSSNSRVYRLTEKRAAAKNMLVVIYSVPLNSNPGILVVRARDGRNLLRPFNARGAILLYTILSNKTAQKNNK